MLSDDYEEGFADGYTQGLLDIEPRDKLLQFKAIICNEITYSSQYNTLSEFFYEYETFGKGDVEFIGDVK